MQLQTTTSPLLTQHRQSQMVKMRLRSSRNHRSSQHSAHPFAQGQGRMTNPTDEVETETITFLPYLEATVRTFPYL